MPGFELEGVLGEGAFGEVYLARESAGLQRRVALKVFRSGVAAFERELEMTRRIEALRAEQRAPHLVQSLGTGEAQGRGWIAFEFLEGGSLQDLIAAEGPLAPGWATRFCCEVARALERLHAAGIFHRDVKPANLLLASDGKVRLGDFGLSRDLSGKLSTAGSPAFAAPEMIAGKVQDGERADVYSLGATLFFLLTGETCHPGHPDVFALESCNVPGGLQLVLVAAMARAPEKRTASAAALRAALEELELPLEEARHVAAAQSPWRQTGGGAPQPLRPQPLREAPQAAPPGARSSWWNSARARRRGALGFGALGLLILVSGGAAWLAEARSAEVEFRLEDPLAGARLRLGEEDLGSLSEPRTLRLAPGRYALAVERDGLTSQTEVLVEPGQEPQVVSVRTHHPLRVEGAEGVSATLRDSRGGPVRARAGWVLEGHPLPFETRLPQGRYRLRLDGPDHHPRELDLALREGGERVRADLRPVRRFGVRVPGVRGFWAQPVALDLDQDGVQDLVFNAYGARDGLLVALSGRDGQVLWRLDEQTNRWARPAIAPGGEIAIGVLAPSEDPSFGIAQALLLDPKSGEPRRRANLGLSSRPPFTGVPFELAGERGLLFVTDCQLAPPWGGARLSALRADGEVLWQRIGPSGDGVAPIRHGLLARTVDADGDGRDESVLWELEGEVFACAPGAAGPLAWRAERGPSSQRNLRWDPDFTELVALNPCPKGGPPAVVALNAQGEVQWRHQLEGELLVESSWHQLDGAGPRELVASTLLSGRSRLWSFDLSGQELARRDLPGGRVQIAGRFRHSSEAYLAVEAHQPARALLLDPQTLATVWSRDLRVADATLSVVDFEGEGRDALVVSHRDGRVEVVDPDLPQ